MISSVACGCEIHIALLSTATSIRQSVSDYKTGSCLSQPLSRRGPFESCRSCALRFLADSGIFRIRIASACMGFLATPAVYTN